MLVITPALVRNRHTLGHLSENLRAINDVSNRGVSWGFEWGGGGSFARTTSYGGLKTCSPRNLRKTFTQVVNILETYETEIENLSAKSSSSNSRRILFNIKSNSSLKDSFLKVLDFLKILCFSVLQWKVGPFQYLILTSLDSRILCRAVNEVSEGKPYNIGPFCHFLKTL